LKADFSGKLLGGDFNLDVEAARAAVNDVAEQMGISCEETAEGIISLVNETMYSALRLVSVEQGHDPRDFAFVAFGGAGPLHANAVGKLLGAWPVIVPQSPGVLCAQGDATTKLSHEQSISYIRLLSSVSSDHLRTQISELEASCTKEMHLALGNNTHEPLNVSYDADLRYKGQALVLTIPITAEDLVLEVSELTKALSKRFDAAHQHQFSFSLPSFELEIMRLGVVATDSSATIGLLNIDKVDNEGCTPPASAILNKKFITVDGNQVEATFWDRRKISKQGYKVSGPCVISEMDSNTLILPGFTGEIDRVGNIIINPASNDVLSKLSDVQHTPKTARAYVQKNPLIPTLIASTLASIRNEMDTLMLRCAMSPAIREQQDEFNVITNAGGQMLVGQFGSFIAAFLAMWRDAEGTIEDGDVFVTNDVYQVGGAVTHLNDVIILLPIFYKSTLVGWSANFGHLT
jgi:5-oxoprolinase (ATP-hydrolysing)